MPSSLKASFHLLLTTNFVRLCPFCGCGSWSLGFCFPSVWYWWFQSKYNRHKSVIRVKTELLPEASMQCVLYKGLDSVSSRNRIGRKEGRVHRKSWQIESKKENEEVRIKDTYWAPQAFVSGYVINPHNNFVKRSYFALLVVVKTCSEIWNNSTAPEAEQGFRPGPARLPTWCLLHLTAVLQTWLQA